MLATLALAPGYLLSTPSGVGLRLAAFGVGLRLAAFRRRVTSAFGVLLRLAVGIRLRLAVRVVELPVNNAGGPSDLDVHNPANRCHWR